MLKYASTTCSANQTTFEHLLPHLYKINPINQKLSFLTTNGDSNLQEKVNFIFYNILTNLVYKLLQGYMIEPTPAVIANFNFLA
jgi:hypothetical protein